MTIEFMAEPVLRQLKSFQRNTVEHVINRFFLDSETTDRFLVADETGLGKTIVARGVVARTIEELQHDRHVDAIDILYICSNTDLAQQNLRKLSVLAGRDHGVASRLTLLAKHMHHLRMQGTEGMKKQVNLISFTPGTSFSRGWATGKAEERAMLQLMIEEEYGLEYPRRADCAGQLFQGGCATVASFQAQVEYLRGSLAARGGKPDPGITRAFLKALRATSFNESMTLHDALSARLDGDEKGEAVTAWHLVGEMRSLLAEVSAAQLTPDLIILDEFQRFRDLIEPGTEAGELAHHLFNYRHESGDHGAKVLMLSATPFKPFTYAEEAADDDHHKDFLKVVDFLTGENTDRRRAVAEAMARYRRAVLTGHDVQTITTEVEALLLGFMSRTERPRDLVEAMATEHITTLPTPEREEVRGYVAMHDLSQAVDAPFNIEYWKSAPYFANFMDTYKVGEKVREALQDPIKAPRICELLRETRQLDFDAIRSGKRVDWGNARLRALAAETVDQGWWKLLWVPPTLPYLAPDTPFSGIGGEMTKRVVFSSWTATPGAVATLLSHEASRQPLQGLSDQEREGDHGSRLDYRLARTQRTPATMSTLALFWPMPGPAAMADPRAHRRDERGRLTRGAFRRRVMQHLRDDHTEGEKGRPWDDLFRRSGALPDLSVPDVVESLAGAYGDDEDARAPVRSTELLRLHVEYAFELRSDGVKPALSNEGRKRAADYAAHAPGNIAWRALRRIAGGHAGVTGQGLWRAAARLASAFRVLFNRPGTAMLLDHLYKGGSYAHKILRYCASGNLQAVMDEYIHHLHMSLGAQALNDEALATIAQTAGNAVALRPARYEVFDPATGERESMAVRFAQRYGGRRQNEESARQPILREAFNSPFWPFVLASTSVGQEGVDFHRYCHSLFHWNVPANPIDFEQREGRVDRHAGHAVRKNVVYDFGDEALASETENPWDEVYALSGPKFAQLGDFAPHWCYPGKAKVERRVALYPLSSDGPQLERVKENVALYRLTFGQPRQEDMLTLIAKQYTSIDEDTLATLRLDLRAPDRGGSVDRKQP